MLQPNPDYTKQHLTACNNTSGITKRVSHAQTCNFAEFSTAHVTDTIRYAGRHTDFWQQNIESKHCEHQSASLPKVCCAHMNEVAAFISGTTRRTEALFRNVSGQITLSKEGGVGDAGQGTVQIASTDAPT